MSQWPEMFRILNLSSASTTFINVRLLRSCVLGPQAQQTEDGAEEEQSCEKLVRIPIEELQDQPESKS